MSAVISSDGAFAIFALPTTYFRSSACDPDSSGRW